MNSILRLFKGVVVKTKSKTVNGSAINYSYMYTIPHGFILDNSILSQYYGKNLDDIIDAVIKEFGLSGTQMNSSFHKSWKKVKDSSMEQLVLEQSIHYFTTYGFEALGIYNEGSVYIPPEKLEVPELKDGINLIVIRGYTKDELRGKLSTLIKSGIALKEDSITDVLEAFPLLGFKEKDISEVKNREVKIALYKKFDIIPEDPVEFLRYIIYVSTGKTLLIKDDKTIEDIQGKENPEILELLVKYKKRYGLEKLSQIFNRFKPLFLAYKSDDKKMKQMNHIINQIRKLSKKNHKPMPEDYLNEITSRLKIGEKINLITLSHKLEEANVFRKIRLAYALKYRMSEPDTILYRIRNGKGYAKELEFTNTPDVMKTYATVMNSVVADIKKNVKGKKIYIPDYIKYALPATEKMFTGCIPSGTCITTPSDMVFGIHWFNLDNGKNPYESRVDLDLSLINVDGKIGWDGYYRSDGGDILFSGDMTDAPKPKGATEMFYVRKNSKKSSIMMVNYFNYSESNKVPYKIIVGSEKISRLNKNHMIDPNNVLAVANSFTDTKQKVLGLIVNTTTECRFYFAETSVGAGISSRNTDYVNNTRKYLFNFYENAISLNEVLETAGAILVKDNKKCDIDLSPENIGKDSIIKLLVKQ